MVPASSACMWIWKVLATAGAGGKRVHAAETSSLGTFRHSESGGAHIRVT